MGIAVNSRHYILITQDATETSAQQAQEQSMSGAMH